MADPHTDQGGFVPDCGPYQIGEAAKQEKHMKLNKPSEGHQTQWACGPGGEIWYANRAPGYWVEIPSLVSVLSDGNSKTNIVLQDAKN